jgi:uncharacterized protein YheU (UPF0270 family)
MLIPHSKFSTPILDDMLSDFVTRDGTDNGNFITLAERKAQLLSQLESHQAFITFNADHQQTCLVTSNEVPDDALRDFKQLVQKLFQWPSLISCLQPRFQPVRFPSI